MMKLIFKRRALLLAAALAAAACSQTPLDRSLIPPPGPTPTLHVPSWSKQTLSNGALLLVCEKHDLPLVSFSITFLGGADQFDPSGRRGASDMMAALLSEGTTSRTGDQLSDDLRLLGTSVSAAMGSEDGSIACLTTVGKFEPTLTILVDMMLNPAFPDDSLERLRARSLVALTQAKSQPASIGSRVYARVLYGKDHPYGIQTSEDSLKAITREDILALHKAYYQPGHAIITVVGDVNPASVKTTLEKAFASWRKGGEKPSFAYPQAPAPSTTTIYLVDKPGAAQSIFAIGLPGPPRSTPDYYSLQVLNFILGGHFQSRLNHNIREEKGYSYGVNSSFAYGKGPGPFRAGGAIVSDKSDAALVEFMKELKGVEGQRPITDAEIKTAKDALIQRLPSSFQSVSAINNAITSLYVEDLPENYYQTYAANISRVTKADLDRVAKKYIDLDHLAIVIVGDRASIEAPLKATGIAPITLRDIEGNPLSSGTP